MDSLINSGENDIGSLLSMRKFWIGKALVYMYHSFFPLNTSQCNKNAFSSVIFSIYSDTTRCAYVQILTFISHVESICTIIAEVNDYRIYK